MEEENKKIRNATKIIYKDIPFRSVLECNCYKLLEAEEDFNVEYETKKIVLLQGFYPSSSLIIYDLYKPRLKKRIFTLDTQKILSMTYTPDFYFQYKDYEIYIESKGHPNDTYPLKKKLFLAYLEKQIILTGKKFIFFEPHNKRQMKETIQIIKSLV